VGAFRPQLVLVSAGFDSAAGDEEGFALTPSGYAALLTALRDTAATAAATDAAAATAGAATITAAAATTTAAAGDTGTAAAAPGVVVVLEGGYNVPAVARGLHACTVALLGTLAGTPPDLRGLAAQASPQARADIAAAVEAQRPFWPCLSS